MPQSSMNYSFLAYLKPEESPGELTLGFLSSVLLCGFVFAKQYNWSDFFFFGLKKVTISGITPVNVVEIRGKFGNPLNI